MINALLVVEPNHMVLKNICEINRMVKVFICIVRNRWTLDEAIHISKGKNFILINRKSIS